MLVRKRKTGIGYTGFIVDYDEKVTIEEDLYRRDTTMNSIAYRVRDGKIIDPYKGREDIEKMYFIKQYHIILKRMPVRALRAARQACELNFKINEDTVNLMRACKKRK